MKFCVLFSCRSLVPLLDYAPLLFFLEVGVKADEENLPTDT